MIAERTGRTLAEVDRMDSAEVTLWYGLLTIVEPHEEEQRQAQQGR